MQAKNSRDVDDSKIGVNLTLKNIFVTRSRTNHVWGRGTDAAFLCGNTHWPGPSGYLLVENCYCMRTHSIPIILVYLELRLQETTEDYLRFVQ